MTISWLPRSPQDREPAPLGIDESLRKARPRVSNVLRLQPALAACPQPWFNPRVSDRVIVELSTATKLIERVLSPHVAKLDPILALTAALKRGEPDAVLSGQGAR